MEITWWGTAAFRVKTGGDVFLIDPYLSRNPKAQPQQPVEPGDITDGAHIFITHGHFDHIMDIPAIVAKTGAMVHCDSTAAETMVRNGLSRDRVDVVSEDGCLIDLGRYQARAFFSEHVKFDKRLLAVTLARINVRIFKYLPLFKQYPLGRVLSWRFTMEGKSLHHFGSGGSSREELERLAKNPTDILMAPLQGHTNICDIAMEYVRALKPKTVIPHHQDDFYPPISQMVDISPFLRGVLDEFHDVEVLEPSMNRPFDS